MDKIKINNLKSSKTILPVTNVQPRKGSIAPERFNTISSPVFHSILQPELTSITKLCPPIEEKQTF